LKNINILQDSIIRIMTKNELFDKTKEYIFTGTLSNFNAKKIEKNIHGHFILGKFSYYTDFPLDGDIIPNTKATFENGSIDCTQFHKIIDLVLSQKKND